MTVRMSRQVSEKHSQSQDDGHESKRCMRSRALGVDRNLDAAHVCDKKTWMERLELVEQGLSKLRALPWLTVAD